MLGQHGLASVRDAAFVNQVAYYGCEACDFLVANDCATTL